MKQIAICLADAAYGQRLVRYLLQADQFMEDIIFYQEIHCCKEHVEQNHVSILVLDDLKWVTKEVADQVDEIVYLSDRPHQAETPTHAIEKIKVCYRYQSMEHLIALLKPIQTISSEITPVQNSLMKINAILVTERPDQVDSMVRTVAEVAKNRKKTLIVDCSQIQLKSVVNEKQKYGQTVYSMSDAIYYLCEEGNFEVSQLKKMVMTDGNVDFLSATVHCMDLMDWRVETTGQLLQVCREAGYEQIVLVMSMFTKALIDLLRNCKNILYLSYAGGNPEFRTCVKEQLTTLLPEESMVGFSQYEMNESKESMVGLQKVLLEAIDGTK